MILVLNKHSIECTYEFFGYLTLWTKAFSKAFCCKGSTAKTAEKEQERF
jgi:hypothetical protein